MSKKFESEFESFIDLLTKKWQKHYNEKYPGQMPEIIVTDENGYRKISKKHPLNTSTYCFINIETGDLHKADWNKPSKKPFGNLYKKDVLDCCGIYHLV